MGESNPCALQRQVDEIEAVQATFPEVGAFVLSTVEELALQEAIESLSSGEENSRGLGSLGFTLNLPDLPSNLSVGLAFSLCSGYPERCSPSLRIEADIPRRIHDHWTKVAQETMVEMEGCECTLVLIDILRNEIEKLVGSEDIGFPGNKAEPSTVVDPSLSLLHGYVIWFHHIKSTKKRQNIVDWARSLNLRGYCKPGYPGIIVCEGCKCDVVEYVKRLRGLRWAAMAIRAEFSAEGPNSESLEHSWHFQDPTFFELGENGMSELSKHCHDANLQAAFLSALKICQ